MALTHINVTPFGHTHARCHCGWVSKRSSNNTRKAWRQHVTRGTH